MESNHPTLPPSRGPAPSNLSRVGQAAVHVGFENSASRDQTRSRNPPFHTIIPGFVIKDAKPFRASWLMGGDMQPRGHVQVLASIIVFGMNVQPADDAASRVIMVRLQ